MTDELEQQLDEIIAEFLQAQEAGKAVAADDVIATHPEFADELREFFDDLGHMEALPSPVMIPVSSGRPVLGKLRYFGDYELLEEIARGGMGIVYRARQTSLNRIVAVKLILAGHLASETDVKRFKTEAESAANLQHPHIVSVHEVGRHDGQSYFSMDYIDGKNLSELVREHPLPARTAAGYVREVAEAIHYAHQQGTLHRDLKPSNVLVDQNDRVQITDFGLAMRVEGDSELTRTGQILGTPSYMPPEQAQHKRGLIGPGSDIYSIGAVLYELLTGRPPFQADSAVETLRQVIETEPLSPRLLNPAVPRDLETICLKCLQKEPHKRYATAQHLADDLGRFLQGEPILARPIGRVARIWRWCKRRPAVAGLTVMSAVAALAFVGVAVSVQDYFKLEESYKRETRLRGELEGVNDELNSANVKLGDTNSQLDNLNSQLTTANAKLEQVNNELTSANNELEGANSKLGELNERLQAESRQKTEAFERAETLSYALQVRSAHRAWLANDVTMAETLLDACPERLRNLEWQYLNGLCHADRQTLPLGEGIEDLSVTQDGNWIAAVSSSNHLLMFKQNNGVFEAVPSFVPDADITCVEFLSQRNGLLVGRTTGKIDLLSLPDGKLVESYALADHLKEIAAESTKAPNCSITTITASADSRFFAVTFSLKTYLNNGGIRSSMRAAVWKRSDPAPFHVTDSSAYLVALNPDGTRAVVASGTPYAPSRNSRLGSAHLSIWDTTLQQELGTLTPKWDSLQAVLCAAFADDGNTLVTGHSDSAICYWDMNRVNESRKVRKFRSHDGPVWDVDVMTDERMVTASSDHALRVWSLDSASELYRMRGHRGEATHVCVTGDGKTVVSAGTDQAIRIWNADEEAGVTEVLPLPKLPYVAIAFSPDGNQIACLENHSRICLVDTDSFEIQYIHNSSSSLAYSTKFSRIITGGNSSSLKLWDTSTREQLNQFEMKGRRHSSRVAFSPDDDHVAVATKEGISVWSLSAGDKPDVFPFDPEGKRMVSDVEFSPDGRLVAFSLGYLNNTNIQVTIYDRISHEVIATFDVPTTSSYYGIYDLEFSPDGQRIAAAVGESMGRGPGEVFVWELNSSKPLFRLRGHRYGVWSISFSPDGKRLASGAGIWRPGPNVGGEIKIWDMEYGQELIHLDGHTGAVMSLDFSPNGVLLASASADHTVRLWGVDVGRSRRASQASDNSQSPGTSPTSGTPSLERKDTP